MTARIPWFRLATSLLFAVVAVGVPGAARADFLIQVQDDGGGTQTFNLSQPSASGSLTTPAITTAHFTVSFINATGTPGSTTSTESQTAFVVTNTDSGSHTLSIMTTVQGYTNPVVAPVLVTDTVAGLITGGTVTGGVFKGSADTTNALTNITAQVGNFTDPALNLSFSGTTGTSFAASGSKSGFSPGGAYSLSTYMQFTLSGHGGLTVTTGSVSAIGANVPVPATLALLACGAPGFLGLGFFLRRRQSAPEA
jgi:hypothetical protein